MVGQRIQDSRKLFTIGYEGIDLPSFIQYLRHNRVAVLVDVRERPLSRKRGFSKTALSDALEESGLTYIHIKDLGSPGAMRKQLYLDWDYEAFFSAYDDYLDGQQEAMNTLENIIEENGAVCLLCFERSHELCHRSRIANRIAVSSGKGLDVQPIIP